MQILKIINICHYPSAVGVVFKVEQHPVHLVEFPFGVAMLYAQLIAVCLADRAVFVRPAVPDVSVQVADIIGFFLPYPQKLLDRRFHKGAT